MELIPEGLGRPDIYHLIPVQRDRTVVQQLGPHPVEISSELVPTQLDPQARNVLALQRAHQPPTITSLGARSGEISAG